MSRSSVGAIILAGGLSTRFGRDKATHRVAGRSLLTRVIEGVRSLAGEVLVVGRAEQDLSGEPGDRVVFDDESAPAGPLRGIVAGLQAATGDRMLVLACDGPEVRVPLLSLLLDSLSPDDLAAVGEWEGRCQPFPAVYRTAAAAPLQALLRAGLRSPRAALRQLAHARVLEAACREADPIGASFLNVNTRRDLRRIGRVGGER